MKKIYELKKSKYIAMLIFALAIFLCLLLDKSFNKPLLKVLGISSSIFWMFIGFPLAISYAIQINEVGLTSVYILRKKIFKIRKHISWVDIANITTNKAGMCVIIPKTANGKTSIAFKHAIIIPKDIKNYKDLLRGIISSAKNAVIDNSIKLHLK